MGKTIQTALAFDFMEFGRTWLSTSESWISTKSKAKQDSKISVLCIKYSTHPRLTYLRHLANITL